MVLVRAALPLAGLLALSSGLAQQSDYRVKAEFSPAAIDRVLARVDAGNDHHDLLCGAVAASRDRRHLLEVEAR